MTFTEAREKFLRAIGGVEAFGLDVGSKGVEELDGIISELIAWFDRRYPHVEQREVRTCAGCGDELGRYDFTSELHDGRICSNCACEE